MKILVLGEPQRTEELKLKISSGHQITAASYADFLKLPIKDQDLIFDLNFEDHTSNLQKYAEVQGLTVIVSAAKTQLAAVTATYGKKIKCSLVGMNALPGFINRPLAELSLLNRDEAASLDKLMKDLGWNYKLVDDRTGMVSPRIVLMIINEAFYTVQEGTASMKDIDLGMKLGTNYPFGPFEWAEKIGIKNVYETLEAVYLDTRDERYKICPLLKTSYFKSLVPA
jgi:3-hydroxybutyryl-CoA dehydrogenase